jgi:NADP-dependent 3-hydroxy acid dehydrogenase YdfG
MNLKGKVAIVTGASDGLGKQVALKLAREGVSLALVARDEARLTEVKDECVKLGSPKVNYYSCDLAIAQSVKETVAKIITDFGSVDILLNIAGVWQKLGQLDEISEETIESVIDINLKGLIRMTQQVLPHLRKSPEAVLINVSSHSGIAVKPGQSIYCASKWGVTGFTEVLREDLKGSNIRVAGLYQGGTQTKLFEKANDPKDPEQFSRFTDPADLADVIIFMLSRPPKIWLHDVRVAY